MYRLIHAFTLGLLLNAGYVKSLREVIAIVPGENRDTDYEPNQQFTRHAREITNEKELFSVNIAPFEIIIVDSVEEFDVEDVEESILSTLKSNLKDYGLNFNSLQSVSSIGDIRIRTIAKRNLKGNKRILNNGKTQIDVDGGEATFFDEFYNIVSSDELSEAAFSVLEKDLKENEIFKGKSIKVVEFVPSNAPSGPSSNAPSGIPLQLSAAVSKGAEYNVNSSGGGTATAISCGVLAVVCVVLATAFFVKKRYGIQMPNFRRVNYNDDEAAPNLMKRDLDFEQFVVECCTDNDAFESDEKFFSTQRQAPIQFDPATAN